MFDLWGIAVWRGFIEWWEKVKDSEKEGEGICTFQLSDARLTNRWAMSTTWFDGAMVRSLCSQQLLSPHSLTYLSASLTFSHSLKRASDRLLVLSLWKSSANDGDSLGDNTFYRFGGRESVGRKRLGDAPKLLSVYVIIGAIRSDFWSHFLPLLSMLTLGH